MKSYLSYMSTNYRGTAILINICMVLKQQISPTLKNTYPPQTPSGPDTTCIPDDNCRHASQMDVYPVGLTLGEVAALPSADIICIGWVVHVADVPHEEPSPNKHPLGRPPPAYEMMTIDTHCTRMCVLWG